MKNKKVKTIRAFSLIEIVVSLAIFSFIITAVITVSISLARAQTKIQAQLFLAQTAQSTLETMSRQIRYGYSYNGGTQASYDASQDHETISFDSHDISTQGGSSGTTTQLLTNSKNSPFILFEAQDGNPNRYDDQNAFCAYGGKLYKITTFQIQTNGTTYFAKCDTGANMLPDNITLDSISFDVFNDSTVNPKNPMVRIKIKLSNPETGSIQTQTTVVQRLISYF